MPRILTVPLWERIRVVPQQNSTLKRERERPLPFGGAAELFVLLRALQDLEGGSAIEVTLKPLNPKP